MVVWLIAVPVLAEVLGALLPTGRVAAVHREKLIKSLGSVRITTKQVDQPLGVLHDMPEPLPGVALAIVVVALPVPSEWAESVHLGPISILVLPTQELRLWFPKIAVAKRATVILRCLFLLAYSLGKTRHRKV